MYFIELLASCFLLFIIMCLSVCRLHKNAYQDIVTIFGDNHVAKNSSAWCRSSVINVHNYVHLLCEHKAGVITVIVEKFAGLNFHGFKPNEAFMGKLCGALILKCLNGTIIPSSYI